MKKTLIITGSIIAVILLAILIVPSILSKDVEVKAKKEIAKKVDATVNFDHTSLSFFRHFPNLTLTLHDLLITGKEEFTGDTLANIKELSLELNIWKAIFSKGVEVKSIDMERPILDIEVLKNGKANYNIFITDTTQTATADTTSSSANVALDQIVIHNGKITYDDKSMGAYVLIDGFEHVGKGDFVKDIFDYSTETSAQELTCDYSNVRYMNKKEVHITMVMEMNTKEGKYSFKENDVTINHFGFSMQGFFTMLANGYNMDLKFLTKETAFRNILSLLPGVYIEDLKEVKTDGEVSFNGFVKGVYSDSIMPSYHVEVKVKDGMFKVDTLPTAVTNIQMDLLVDNPYGISDSMVIDLKNFNMDMGKHPVHGRLKVQGLSAYKVDADIIADMELAELETMYPIKGLDMKGKLDFELKAKGTYKNIYDAAKMKGKAQTGFSKPQQVPTFHLNMKLANGKIKYDSLPTAIENIQLELLADNTNGDIDNTVVDFKSIHLDLGKNPVHGFIKIEGYEKYKLETDIKAHLDLADVEKMYPVQGVELRGIFDLDVEASGIYDAATNKQPAIDAKMNLTDGYIKSQDYPEPMENIHLIAEATNKTGNMADARLTISRLTYTLEGEPFEVSGSINDFVKYNYDLKIKGVVDLAKITKIYPVPGMKLSGIIDTDIETKGRVSDIEAGNYSKVSSSGDIEIKELTIKGDSIPHTIIIKDALFTFTPAKIVLERFNARLGKSDIEMTGDLYNYMAFATKTDNDMIKGDLDLKSDLLDLNQWLADTTTSSKKATTAATQGKAADTSKAQIGVWEVPKNVDFVFDSEIKKILYEDMVITDMDGEIKIKDGVLSMKESGFNTLEAKFGVSGEYDTRDIKHPLFDFDLEIAELDIHKAYKEIKMIRDMAPSAGNVYGKFSVSYKLKGELDKDMSPKTETLLGGGQIRIAEAKVNGMKMFDEVSKKAKKEEINDPHLKDFVMDSEIKDNKIYVKPFSIKIAGLDTDIEGVSDMGGAINYIVKIDLLPLQKLKVPFHVTGTSDNPKVELGKGHTLPD